MRCRWGAVQLENAMPTKSIDIKIADNKPILILYLWLKDTVERDTRAPIHRIFSWLKANQDNSITYWQFP